MSTKCNLESSVGQWVAEHPSTSRVFEVLHIDYCCGGRRSLADACRQQQLDERQVLEQLEGAVRGGDTTPIDQWNAAALTALCDHIEQTHHAYLKSELPRLQGLIEKVLNAHGASHPELAQVQQAFAALQAELVPHMFKEDRILFPAIRALEQAAAVPQFPFGSVADPIRMMEHEHEIAGDALAIIRTATNQYAVPEDGCNTYRALLDGLHTLELDMHRHVHKENNILFPRAIELERTRAAG